MTDDLRDRIAAALYERERPPRDPHWPNAYAADREVFEAMADAALGAVQPELDALAALRAVSRGYCPGCGRGDAAPSVADWEQQKTRADKAEELLRIAHDTSNKSEAERARFSRMHLTALGNLGIATHRLDQIRDAARLHEQTLISTRELYAVIDADSAPVPAATETTEPERCCVCGGGPIAHHNYREQPFCWACADCPCNQVPCIREGLHQSADGKLKVAEQRARNAEARIRLAREALIHDGYFTADEIGDDIAPRIVEWLSHHRSLVEEAEAEVARLRAGEEPGWDPLIVPTPGQWIARWNRASAAERLDVAKRVIANTAKAGECFEMNHAARLEEDRQAWAALARVRDLRDAWLLMTLEPGQVRRLLDEITHALDGPGQHNTACAAYRPPATPADSGLCARCGMYDYKHQEATSA